MVDANRIPGRFIFVGSANILITPKLPFVGRVTMHPMGTLIQGELKVRHPGFLDTLFNGEFDFATGERMGESLADRIVTGGVPGNDHCFL